MHRIDSQNAVNGRFVAGNPATGTPPTYFSADWCNALQEETAGVIEGAGLTLDKTKNNQLFTAIKKLAGESSGSGGDASALLQEHENDDNPHNQYVLKQVSNEPLAFLAGWIQSKRDFTKGTLITTNINYSTQNGEPFVLEIKGNSYGVKVPFDTQIQGYIYNNTIINLGGISKGCHIESLSAFNLNGKLCFWMPRMAYWQGCLARIYVPSIKSQYPTWHSAYENLIVSIDDVDKPTDITKEVDFTPHILQSFNSGNIAAMFAAICPKVIFKMGASAGADFKSFDELLDFIEERLLYHVPISVQVEDGEYKANIIKLTNCNIKFTGNLINPNNCIVKFDRPDANKVAHGFVIEKSVIELSGFKVQGITTAECWTVRGIHLSQSLFYAQFGTLIIDGAVQGIFNKQSVAEVSGIKIINFKDVASYTFSGGETHIHLAKIKSNLSISSEFRTIVPAHLKGAGKPYNTDVGQITAQGIFANDAGNVWGVNVDIEDVYHGAYANYRGYLWLMGAYINNVIVGQVSVGSSVLCALKIGKFKVNNQEYDCRDAIINAKHTGISTTQCATLLIDNATINAEYRPIIAWDNSHISAFKVNVTGQEPVVATGRSFIRCSGIFTGTNNSPHILRASENSCIVDGYAYGSTLKNGNVGLWVDELSYIKSHAPNFINCNYRTSAVAVGLQEDAMHNKGSYVYIHPTTM